MPALRESTQRGTLMTMQTAAPPPSAPSQSAPKSQHRLRSILIVIALLIAAFLIGYVPQRLAASRAERELASVRFDREIANLHRQLGVASHEAMRNNYASAAAAAGKFFDGLTEFVNTHPLDAYPRTRAAFGSYVASRDGIMAQLAAGDPATRDALAGMFLAMDGVIQRRE